MTTYNLAMGLTPIQTGVGYYSMQILNGLVLGMILVLIALGLSIIFGTMGIVNFAHGSFLLIGAYITLAVMKYTGSFIIGVLVASVSVGIVGGVIERTTLQMIYDRDILLQFLLTFGIAEILREGVMIIWGRARLSFPTPEWGEGSINLIIFSYSLYRSSILIIGTAVIISVYLFLIKTDVGLILRAAVADREMVSTIGIDIKKMYLLAFVLGSAIAGLAGGLIGPMRTAYPTLGIDLLIPAFVVVVIGGLGSIRGSILAGLLVGQLMVLTGIVFPRMSNVIVFLFMALVLLLRPRGLFGREVGI